MIRFRALGSLDLHSARGGELRALLVQPKRLALFTYLVCANPPRLHRRDSLLALFWPESTEEDARRSLSDRTYVEEKHRRRIEEMLLEPEKHKWVRIDNEDIGEPGCKHWHVMPRWGLLGILMNWWRVRISSGCPLPEGHRNSR